MSTIVHEKYAIYEKLNFFEKIYYQNWPTIIKHIRSTSCTILGLSFGAISILPNNLKEIMIIAIIYWLISTSYVIYTEHVNRESVMILLDPEGIF